MKPSALGNVTDFMFADSAGGIQISGDSGTGKSMLMAFLMVTLAKMGHGLFLLDPHGDLARLVRRILLTLGASVEGRIRYYCPADTSVVTPFNPVAVERDGLSEDEWESRLCQKVAKVSRILLHAWGETDFNSKPLLFKWTTRLIETVARIGLPLTGVQHFLDVSSDVYSAIIRQVGDPLAQAEFAELSDMRPADRETLIASTKNRFIGFLKSPIVRNTLGTLDRGVRIRKMMDENAIVLVDLSPQGKLRPEDQQIFANLWLTEILDEVYNCPEGERVWSALFIDELPVFESCADQLNEALRQIRKMKLRIIGAHQGTNFFRERTEDRLLHSFVAQCATHFFFRHIDPVDAKFFAEIPALPSLDPMKVKHVLTQWQQYQAGNRLVTLTDESESSATGRQLGGGQTRGTNQADNWNSDLARGETDSVSDTDTRGTSDSSGTSVSHGTTDSESTQLLRTAVTRARASSIGMADNAAHADTASHGHTTGHSTNTSRRQGHGGSLGSHVDQSSNWSTRPRTSIGPWSRG